MVIGDFLGYGSLGLGSAHGRGASSAVRQAITLEAKPDPKTPNEYSVEVIPEVIVPPEKPSEAKYTAKKQHQNTDAASRAFFSVADYEPKARHYIDIQV